MSLREIAQREPEPAAPDSGLCPTCCWHDAMAREAFKGPEGLDRSKLTDVTVLRRKHREVGECLNPDTAA
ncbi:hypothetical protein [Kitasatospora sp. NPDC088861]|uniref:hypothetical protein n=1 Tax=Kitasatospora sp. NPDC088861 TaxID=3364078 RepID=UPI0037FF91D8